MDKRPTQRDHAVSGNNLSSVTLVYKGVSENDYFFVADLANRIRLEDKIVGSDTEVFKHRYSKEYGRKVTDVELVSVDGNLEVRLKFSDIKTVHIYETSDGLVLGSGAPINSEYVKLLFSIAIDSGVNEDLNKLNTMVDIIQELRNRYRGL